MTAPAQNKLTRRDFDAGIDVRWCPGCGDYAVLANMQRTLPTFGIPREKFVFVSGIGCSSRFPYYMNTYGMHTIHGRAPAFATGLKSFRPDLQVWVVTGDGDGLSIGGNHLIHAIRRNVDIKILLFNNQIYGLTKGQYSPTSEVGKTTKSSPLGSVDAPLTPLSLSLGANATFAARVVDTDAKMMQDVLAQAQEHKGTAMIEILQNCPVFNDKAFEHVEDKKSRADAQLVLREGEPMIFGKDVDRGVVLDIDGARVVDVSESNRDSITVHDPTRDDLTLAFALSRLEWPQFPVPVGVLRRVSRPVFNEVFHAQVEGAQEKQKQDLNGFLRSSGTWRVD